MYVCIFKIFLVSQGRVSLHDLEVLELTLQTTITEVRNLPSLLLVAGANCSVCLGCASGSAHMCWMRLCHCLSISYIHVPGS